MQINFPSEIKSSKLGYEILINIFNKCSILKNQYVYLNFRNVRFFEANLCSLLGAIFEVLIKNDCKFVIVEASFKVEEVFSKNGFNLHYRGIPKTTDNFGTTVGYRTFDENDSDDVFTGYVLEELLSKPNFPKMTGELSTRILTNIFETYVNAITHGKCDFVHTCGQFFPSKGNKPLNFTVVDLGINMKENVENYLGYDISATEAISWAMKRKNSTKNIPGGLGLSEILQFIKLNKGKFEIVSSNGYYRILNDHIETYTLAEEFPGTIVNFMFNLSDNKSYSLK